MSLAYVENPRDPPRGIAIQLRGEKIYCGNKYILDARGNVAQFPDCFIGQVYPVSSALPRQGTK